MAIPAMALLQQHDARRYILIEPAARQHAVTEAWGHSELGVQSDRKNQPACFRFCWLWVYYAKTAKLVDFILGMGQHDHSD